MQAVNRVQYTVRGVPAEVDLALRRKARERGISLNKLLVEELCGAGGVAGSRKYRRLDHLKGRWREDPEFNRIVEEQRVIDKDMWK